MINDDFNCIFIDELISRTKSKSEIASYLMDAVYMSKESAYRRLRGEVPFTLSEACALAKRLDISLDDIVFKKSGKLIYELKMDPEALLDYHYEKLFEHENSYKLFSSAPTHIMTAWNVIPYSMFFPYENLSKIYYFKWLHLVQPYSRHLKFADLVWPDHIKEVVKKLGNTTFPDSDITYIFDRNIFKRFINEIQHYHTLEMFSDEDLNVLKKEFLELLEVIENVTETGTGRGGNKYSVYLSDIDFDHNYTYVGGENFENAYMDNIYMMNTIYTTNPKIVNAHKNFIESLKKYSTLISVSGHLERQMFFNEQKKLVQ